MAKEIYNQARRPILPPSASVALRLKANCSPTEAVIIDGRFSCGTVLAQSEMATKIIITRRIVLSFMMVIAVMLCCSDAGTI